MIKSKLNYPLNQGLIKTRVKSPYIHFDIFLNDFYMISIQAIKILITLIKNSL